MVGRHSYSCACEPWLASIILPAVSRSSWWTTGAIPRRPSAPPRARPRPTEPVRVPHAGPGAARNTAAVPAKGRFSPSSTTICVSPQLREAASICRRVHCSPRPRPLAARRSMRFPIYSMASHSSTHIFTPTTMRIRRRPLLCVKTICRAGSRLSCDRRLQHDLRTVPSEDREFWLSLAASRYPNDIRSRVVVLPCPPLGPSEAFGDSISPTAVAPSIFHTLARSQRRALHSEPHIILS